MKTHTEQTHTVTVHEFMIGDSEDLEFFIMDPIYRWQQTEQGQWCTENSLALQWTIDPDQSDYHHIIKVQAVFTDEQYTWWILNNKG
jgi:hypothetical protein